MRRVALALCALVLVSTTSFAASATTLTFDSLGVFDLQGATGPDTYMQDGYTVAIEDLSHFTDIGTRCPGPPGAGEWCWSWNFFGNRTVTRITREDGGTFDFLSVQVLQNSETFIFSADDGASYSFDGPGTVGNDPGELGAAFRDVTVVRIEAVGQIGVLAAIDNVNVVPEPGMGLLLATGLVGLVARQRRHWPPDLRPLPGQQRV